MNEIFHAQWIKAKKNGKMNAVSFIKTFPVCGAVRRATLSLTAHGVFQAKVGGKPVSDEVLAPGWTVYDKRLQYREYEITELLKDGDNLIEVSVGRGWFFHKTKEWAIDGMQPDEAALIAAIVVEYEDGTQEALSSGEVSIRPV